MPTTVQFGRPFYLVYTQEELERMGLVINPNMYIGDGWRHCITCKRYAYVFAMSHRGQSGCSEVCRECKTHSRSADNPITDPAYVEYTKTFPLNDPRD